MASEDAVRREIESLHAFFVAWFSGAVANDDALFAERLSAHLDDSGPTSRQQARSAPSPT